MPDGLAEPFEIAQVEDAHADVGVLLPQQAELAILTSDQTLAHRRQLDVELVVGEEEVRRDELLGLPVAGPAHREGGGLIGPADAVEGQKTGEDDLGGVGKSLACRLELPLERRQELLAWTVPSKVKRWNDIIPATAATANRSTPQTGCPRHGLPVPCTVARGRIERRHDDRSPVAGCAGDECILAL